MIRLILIAVVGTLVASCVTTRSDRAMKIREADDKMVAACEFLGTVEGSSYISGIMASTGRANAKNDAYEKAARTGATHVVQVASDSSYGSGFTLIARAYRCSTTP